MPTSRRRGLFDATVAARVTPCREHYRLTLAIADFPPTAPGQFVQLRCRPASADDVDHEFEWSRRGEVTIEGEEFAAPLAFLRRPFSIAGRRERGGGMAEVDVIGREVGPGTRFLSTLKVGDPVSLLGPLGNAFELPKPGGLALLVGGGVGIPPMLYLAQSLVDAKAVAFCGATTRDLLAMTITNDAPPPGPTDADPRYNVAEFDRHGIPTVVTTDDGSYGLKGYVTDALERYLDAWITDNADRNRTTVYTCGPEPMMKRVASIAAGRNVRCQVAVERAMACGMGTCQSCCIKVKKPDPAVPPLAGQDWCYRLACTDGPVFDGDALLW